MALVSKKCRFCFFSFIHCMRSLGEFLWVLFPFSILVPQDLDEWKLWVSCTYVFVLVFTRKRETIIGWSCCYFVLLVLLSWEINTDLKKRFRVSSIIFNRTQIYRETLGKVFCREIGVMVSRGPTVILPSTHGSNSNHRRMLSYTPTIPKSVSARGVVRV